MLAQVTVSSGNTDECVIVSSACSLASRFDILSARNVCFRSHIKSVFSAVLPCIAKLLCSEFQSDGVNAHAAADMIDAKP